MEKAEENGDDSSVKHKKTHFKPLVSKQMHIKLKTTKSTIAKWQKALNGRANQPFFEETVRKKASFEQIITLLSELELDYEHLIAVRHTVYRYISSEMLKFINNNKITKEQPELPKLEGGIGIIANNLLIQYFYAYYRANNLEKGMTEAVNKKGKKMPYVLSNSTLDGLFGKGAPTYYSRANVLKVGDKYALDFSSIQRLLSHFIYKNIPPTEQEILLYAETLENFSNTLASREI